MTVLAASAAGPTILVTSVGEAEGSRGAAAALACTGADVDLATLLVDVGGKAPRPTLLASASARSLEERLVGHLPQARVAARGQVCHLAVPAAAEGLAVASAAVAVNRGALAVLHLPPALASFAGGAARSRAVRRPPARRHRGRSTPAGPGRPRPDRPRARGGGAQAASELGCRAPGSVRSALGGCGRRIARESTASIDVDLDALITEIIDLAQ